MTIDLRDRILDVPDFPTEGIVFKDVMPLLADPAYFAEAIRQLSDWSRPRANRPDPRRRSPRVHLRRSARLRARRGVHRRTKPGSLPRETVEATYALEYGTDSLQVHRDAISEGARVIVLDDVLATGGTARAKIDLVERLGGVVAGALFVIELTFLDGGLGWRVRRSLADPVLTSSAASDRQTTTRTCTTR